jgi:uncharacterized membrane protein YeaQ/YmgE (transglycosylase-associated protein family)
LIAARHPRASDALGLRAGDCGQRMDRRPVFAFGCARAAETEQHRLENHVHLPTLFQPYQTLALILLIGLVAGGIAARFMTKYGMGIVGDVIVGVIGAYIGNWLAPRLGVHFGTGLMRVSLNATVGAIVLLLLVRLIRRI